MDKQETGTINEKIYCTNCGGENKGDSRFCVYCGNQLNKIGPQAINYNNANYQQQDSINKTMEDIENNKKNAPRKHGFFVVLGILFLFIFVTNIPILGLPIFATILYFYEKKEKAQKILKPFLVIIGVMGIMGVLLLLITLGMCFAGLAGMA